jgi:hypothetical protein
MKLSQKCGFSKHRLYLILKVDKKSIICSKADEICFY